MKKPEGIMKKPEGMVNWKEWAAEEEPDDSESDSQSLGAMDPEKKGVMMVHVSGQRR